MGQRNCVELQIGRVATRKPKALVVLLGGPFDKKKLWILLVRAISMLCSASFLPMSDEVV